MCYFQEDERRSERSHRPEAETFEEGSDEGEYTDADDFIVDDDGRPIAEKRKKKKPIFSDAYVKIKYFYILYTKLFSQFICLTINIGFFVSTKSLEH